MGCYEKLSKPSVYLKNEYKIGYKSILLLGNNSHKINIRLKVTLHKNDVSDYSQNFLKAIYPLIKYHKYVSAIASCICLNNYGIFLYNNAE